MSDTADELRESLEAVYWDFNAREPGAVLARMTDDVEWPDGWRSGRHTPTPPTSPRWLLASEISGWCSTATRSPFAARPGT